MLQAALNPRPSHHLFAASLPRPLGMMHAAQGAVVFCARSGTRAQTGRHAQPLRAGPCSQQVTEHTSPPAAGSGSYDVRPQETSQLRNCTAGKCLQTVTVTCLIVQDPDQDSEVFFLERNCLPAFQRIHQILDDNSVILIMKFDDRQKEQGDQDLKC